MSSVHLSRADIRALKRYREIMARPEVAELAKEDCTTNRMNGVLENISAGKGGRVQ